MSGQMEVSESANRQCVVLENPGIDAARQECQIRSNPQDTMVNQPANRPANNQDKALSEPPTGQDKTVIQPPNVQEKANSELPDAPDAMLSSSSLPLSEVLINGTAEGAAASTRAIASIRGNMVNEKFLDRHHLWLTTGFFSQHFTSNNHFNQLNTGVGAELQVSKHNTLTGGYYFNSIRQNSFYAADEIRWQIKDYPIKVGGGLGIVSGYRTSFPIIPLALPMVSFEENKEKHPHLSHLGADFVLIPPIGNKVTGTPAVAAVRLKFAWGAR